MAALPPGRVASLAPAPAGGPVTGAAFGTWPAWIGAATGTRTVLGAASGTWAAWAGTATGTRTVNGSAAATWAGWTGTAPVAAITLAYRPITVDNTGGDAKTNHQVLVELDDTTFDFAAVTDSAQLEFRADDGSTVLDHWVESFDTGNETAALWVKVPTIGAGATATVRLYYGSTVTGASSAHDTFIVGEDFRTSEPVGSLLSAVPGGSVEIANRNGDLCGDIAAIGGTGWRQSNVREQSNIVYTGTEFVLLVTGRTTSGTASVGLYHADTVDGTWTEYASNPVLPLAEDPYIVVNADGTIYTDNDDWHYVNFERKSTDSAASANDVGVARTKNFRTDWEVWNGSTWTTSLSTHAIVLARGAAASWDQDFAQSPTTIWDGTQFVCMYEGASGSNFRTGVARSPDLVTWTKEATNPVSAHDVIDDLYFDGTTWWAFYHGNSSGLYRQSTSDDPADWDSSSWADTPGQWELDGDGSCVNLCFGPDGATRWLTFQQTNGTSAIQLWNWTGPDWVVVRTSNGRPTRHELDVVDDALRLRPEDSGAGQGDVGLYTAGTPLTSNFEIVTSRKVEPQTDDQNAGVAVGSGAVTVQGTHLTFADGYVFNVLNPAEVIGIRKYTGGSIVNATDTTNITEAEHQSYARHAMSYLTTGELDYKVNGTSRVSRTDTTHVAASKRLFLWQVNGTTRRGGEAHYEWVVVRNYDGVDPAVTVGTEVRPETVTGTAVGTWAAWSGVAAGTRTVTGAGSATWAGWTGTASVGGNTVVGTATGTWAAWTGTATATRTVNGVASATWGGWTGSALVAADDLFPITVAYYERREQRHTFTFREAVR